jgi:hypothetical protein
VEDETIDLAFTLTYQENWEWDDVEAYVETALTIIY